MSISRLALFPVAIVAILALMPLMPSAASAQTSGAAQDSVETQGAQPPTTTVQQTPPPPQQTKPKKDAGFFSKGRVRGAGLIGLGRSFDQSYLLVGVGIGYFVLNGLAVALDVEGWILNSPQIWRFTPYVNYTIWQSPKLKPFLGAFYRWSTTTGDGSQNIDDWSSYGGRIGIWYKGTPRSYVGIAGVYEKFIDCTETQFNTCDQWYPQLMFVIGI